jgi:hypothetical protein
MNYPTVLSPWFVVQKTAGRNEIGTRDPIITHIVYFCSQEVSPDEWTTDKKKAMLMMSIHSAAQISKATGGEIRALVTQEDSAEFGR